jgi:hypothetical protein
VFAVLGLAAAGLLLTLGRRSPAAESGAGELHYRAPTPAELRRALASIRTPRDFHMTRACWFSARGPEKVCAVRFPSVPATEASVRSLEREAGLSNITSPEYDKPLTCLGPLGKKAAKIMACLDNGMIDGQYVGVAVESVEVYRGAIGYGTSLPFGRKRHVRGTVMKFTDFGYPTAATR